MLQGSQHKVVTILLCHRSSIFSFLKQVVQSSRKCSSGTSMDDFLGFVEFPIKVELFVILVFDAFGFEHEFF